MIQRDASDTSGPSPRTMPPLWPALAAMTGLQALVALALFAPGVLGPRLDLDVGRIGTFTTAVFAVGMLTSLYGGWLAQRFGPCRVAALCAVAVAFGMAVAAQTGSAGLIVAGLCIGLAFGPETPASSTLLSVLARPEQRPLIFSIRQTGNQIGAMTGSLALPLIAAWWPQGGFWLIAAVALCAVAGLAALSRRYDPAATGGSAPVDVAAAVTMAWREPALRKIALLSMPFSAMQLALNAYLVTFAVDRLALGHVAAGALLATAQAGGLVGRLLWGWVASRAVTARRLLVVLGVGMSVAAASIALMDQTMPFLVFASVAFLFGLTASGWNGVFLAEVARLAPSGRVAEATGAVLTVSYAGLLAGPAIVAATAAFGGLSLSYLSLAVLVLAATLPLLKEANTQRGP